MLMQRIFARNIAGTILKGIGSVFLVASFYFFMAEFAHISRTISFLVLAIWIFIAGFYIKTKGGVHYAEIKKGK